MRHSHFFGCALLGAALVFGCKSSNEPANNPSASASPSMQSEQSAASSGSASETPPMKTAEAQDKAAVAGQPSAAQPAAAEAAAPTTQPAGGMTAEAQKLLDQTTEYIKNNKLDLADKSVSQLEQMKPQLPTEYGPKIDNARQMLDMAKKGQGLLGGSAK